MVSFWPPISGLFLQLHTYYAPIRIQSLIIKAVYFTAVAILIGSDLKKAVPIFAENELLLFAKVVDVKLQFEKNKQGKIVRLFILKRGNKTIAEKK